MTFVTFIRAGAAAAVLALSGTGIAQAQTCTATEFSSKTGQVYLDAETALMQNQDYTTALAKLNQLRSMELNCYERGAALQLSAAIKIESGDTLGAVDDLLQAIQSGAIPRDRHPQIYYNVAQIYLQNERVSEAKSYMQRWIQSGVTPTRDQNWQLAVIWHKTGDDRGAIQYAEKVLATDGQNAKRETIDFLIFLYDKTGDLAKKAQLLERLLQQDPSDRRVWDAIAGDYFQGNQERKAFEVQKAMYFAGLLKTEDELKRIVNFYNTFDVPYEAAKILEKEMNAGRIAKNLDNYDLLANLYQVAREYERAIPVIRAAANLAGDGKMDERLGRSYFELGQHENAIEALTKALNRGGLNEPGFAWVLIGQSHYEQDNREAAREAFNKARDFRDGRRAANGWLSFMDSEVATAKALRCFNISNRFTELDNEQKRCKQLAVLGGENVPEACSTIEERRAEVRENLEEQGCESNA